MALLLVLGVYLMCLESRSHRGHVMTEVNRLVTQVLATTLHWAVEV